MTSIQIKSAHFSAVYCQIVTIEAAYGRGFSGITLVGSNSEVCKGGLMRSQAVLESFGCKLTERKILISLYPAELKKEGSHFDLAFTLALFALTQGDKDQVRSDIKNWVFASEVALNGELIPIKNATSFALCAIEAGCQGMVVSIENYKELKELSKVNKLSQSSFEILSFKTVADVLDWSVGKQERVIDISDEKTEASTDQNFTPNFDDMLLSKELFDIAAAVATGEHNLFLSGTPGTGKSMFSGRLASILPKLEGAKKVECLRIHSSFSNKIEKKLLSGLPPFRSPHHSTSSGAIIGSEFSPGEIALAHNGIMFMDEFPEFRKDIIEALREPLETGCVTVSRSKTKTTWKSNFILVIAANNCPCGWLGSQTRRCICPSQKIIHYKRKLSGPILDRIDIHMNLNESMIDGLSILSDLGRKKPIHSQSTQKLLELVQKARSFSYERNQRWGLRCNKELKGEHLMEAFALDEKDFQNLLLGFNLKKFSNRSLFKILKVSRTLADLEFSEIVKHEHLQKAIEWSSISCAKSRGDLAYGFS